MIKIIKIQCLKKIMIRIFKGILKLTIYSIDFLYYIFYIPILSIKKTENLIN